MANTFHGNRFIIDTAGATLLVAALAQGLDAKNLHIIGIRWVGATTNAHTAVIQDANSAVLWASQEATAVLGQPQESNIPIRLSSDFKVPTLASGVLYIYIAQ